MSTLFPNSVVLTQDSAGVMSPTQTSWYHFITVYSIALFPPSLLAPLAISKSTSTPASSLLMKRSARLRLVRHRSTRESQSVFRPNQEFFPPTNSILLLTKKFLVCGLKILSALSGRNECRYVYGNKGTNFGKSIIRKDFTSSGRKIVALWIQESQDNSRKFLEKLWLDTFPIVSDEYKDMNCKSTKENFSYTISQQFTLSILGRALLQPYSLPQYEHSVLELDVP